MAAIISLTPGCTVPAKMSSESIAKPVKLVPVQPNESIKLQKALLAHYQSWKGAPYRYGGLSRRGIDCSGFVYLTYRNVLGIKLPRSTKLLSRSGRVTAKRDLTTGDLLIFNTAPKTLHVGIYIGDNRFMHASKSRGVMLSELSNPYWTDRYWKSIRILQ